MPEKEIKFSEAEIDKKQEEAQEMDKKAKEMIEKGEAKTPQEAVDKMEKKELEKSPEEMLKQALLLVWEEALKFAKEKGFDNSEEIKKRIDLAKKYNLEVEHFFYDPEKLEGKIPTKEQIEKTAKELEYVREFAEEFSKQSKKPVFCIFNARNGTIYSYGMDAWNAQLNLQFRGLSKQENKSVPGLREDFVRDLGIYGFLEDGKKLGLMELAEEWIEEKKLSYFLVCEKNVKFPSGGVRIDNYFFPSGAQDLIKENFQILFVDTGYNYNEGPGSFLPFIFALREINEDLYPTKEPDPNEKEFYAVEHAEIWRRKKYLDKNLSDIISLSDAIKKIKELGALVVLLDPLVGKRERAFFDPLNPASRKRDLWWDNFPQALGARVKKFEHPYESRIYPAERLVATAQKAEYLSEKVKQGLRYYQKDEQGRNWFERNFEGIMLGKKDTPEKGVKEYLTKFRKWVPYETDEKGEAKLDDKGYPIPQKTAPMTMAAEDELARLEAAMEELNGQTFN